MEATAPKTSSGLSSTLMQAVITGVAVGAVQKLGVYAQLAIAGVLAGVWMVAHRKRVPTARARRVTAWLIGFATIVAGVAGWIIGIGVGIFALVALALLLIVLLRRSGTSSLAQALGTAFVGAAVGFGAQPIARFAQDPVVTVRVDNHCPRSVSLQAGPVEITELSEGVAIRDVPAVVVRVDHRGNHIRIRGLPVPIDAASSRPLRLTFDGKPIPPARETRLDLRDGRDHRLAVSCG